MNILGPFTKSIGVIAGGASVSQLLVVIAAPLLTRLYDPEHFGALAVFVALLSVVSTVGSMRYELALPIAKDDREAKAIFGVCVFSLALTSILVALVLYAFGRDVAQRFGIESNTVLLAFLPVAMILVGFYGIANHWLLYRKNYALISRGRMVQAVVLITSQCVLFPLGALGLVIGRILAYLAELMVIILKSPFRLSRVDFTLKQSTSAITRHRKFPMYSAFDSIINACSAQILPLFLAANFGVFSSGSYSLAQRVLELPIALVGAAIGQVFFSQASSLIKDGHLAQSLKDLQQRMILLSLPPFLILTVCGEPLFKLFFGESWTMGGAFAGVMALYIFFRFLASPLSVVFWSLEKQSSLLVFQIILLVSRLLGMAIGASLGGPLTCVVGFSFASAICYLVLLVWINIVTGVNNLQTLKDISFPLILSLASVLPAIILADLVLLGDFHPIKGIVLMVPVLIYYTYLYLLLVDKKREN